jgi:hypothetical protein
MTPKEKAEELFNKMLFCYQGNIDEYTAKQCALIAVDEIKSYLWNTHNNPIDYRYWVEVKQEIENL